MTATQQEAAFAEIYNPKKILDHPDFKVLKQGEKPAPDANIAAFYNPAHEIHLVQKPKPKPGPGQVLLHVRATGICGYVCFRLFKLDTKAEFRLAGAMFISGSTVGLEIPWLLPMRSVCSLSMEKVRRWNPNSPAFSVVQDMNLLAK